jgi:hypothetical protein
MLVGAAQLRCRCLPAIAAEAREPITRNRANYTGLVHFSNAVVGGIHDIKAAGRIDFYRARISQRNVNSGIAV